MNTRELDRTLFAGIAWTAVLRWFGQLVSWSATLYVVRILSPGDYGLAALAMIPIGFARLVENFGLESVVLQDRTLHSDDVSRLASVGVMLALLLVSVFAITSPLVADYFHEPALQAMVVVLSATLLFDALQIVPRALLQRDLEYQKLAILSFVQTVAGAGTMVVLATTDFGAWSLVLNTVAGSLLISVLLWRLRPIRLAWPRKITTLLRPLLSGWRVLVAHSAWYGYMSADSAIVGRMLGKEQTGIYSMALVLANIPTQELAAVLGRVVPGIFTRTQDERQQLRRYFLLLTEGMSYLTLPVAAGIALTAYPLVEVLFGPKWLDAAAPLRILCAFVAFHTMQMLAPHVISWTGHFRALMWINLFGLVVLPAAFFFGIQWGLEGVAWAWVIAYPIAMLPGLILSHRVLGLKWGQYFAAMAPASIACAVMIVIVNATIHSLQGYAAHVHLPIEVAVGAASYAAVLAVGFRDRITRVLAVIRGNPEPE